VLAYTIFWGSKLSLNFKGVQFYIKKIIPNFLRPKERPWVSHTHDLEPCLNGLCTTVQPSTIKESLLDLFFVFAFKERASSLFGLVGINLASHHVVNSHACSSLQSWRKRYHPAFWVQGLGKTEFWVQAMSVCLFSPINLLLETRYVMKFLHPTLNSMLTQNLLSTVKSLLFHLRHTKPISVTCQYFLKKKKGRRKHIISFTLIYLVGFFCNTIILILWIHLKVSNTFHPKLSISHLARTATGCPLKLVFSENGSSEFI
jgi:hypothetical protein